MIEKGDCCNSDRSGTVGTTVVRADVLSEKIDVPMFWRMGPNGTSERMRTRNASKMVKNGARRRVSKDCCTIRKSRALSCSIVRETPLAWGKTGVAGVGLNWIVRAV